MEGRMYAAGFFTKGLGDSPNKRCSFVLQNAYLANENSIKVRFGWNWVNWWYSGM